MVEKILRTYFTSFWCPALVYAIAFCGLLLLLQFQQPSLSFVIEPLSYIALFAFFGILSASVANLLLRRWELGVWNLFVAVACCVGTVILFMLQMTFEFGPSDDGFADDLTIPEGIEIAIPDADGAMVWRQPDRLGKDDLRDQVRGALAIPGNNNGVVLPMIPSLRRASTEHIEALHEYLEASPHWHIFFEQGSRFAARRWSYGGEPRDSLHGYVSEFREEPRFQTRCLLCLDCEPWGRYTVQHVQESDAPFTPKIDVANALHESRVMIECGGVWVEVFEQSNNLERRVTKATLAALEVEFSEFSKDPQTAIARAKAESRELAQKGSTDDVHLFRLVEGMQPGIYEVAYRLNPGEPGSVYLKAFELTKGTPLSAQRLAIASKTRMTWSPDTSERFSETAGFTIYEGDWGKPYAGRFELWFEPDSGQEDRKLAERVFKIEGWQR